MPLTYGVDGIRKLSYHVHVRPASDADYATMLGHLEDALTYFDTGNYSSAYASYLLYVAYLEELGECVEDSIALEIAEGESIRGNVVGEIPYSKNGSFKADLINTIQANIDALTAMDTQELFIMLTEVAPEETKNFDGAIVKYARTIIVADTVAIIAGSTSKVGSTGKVSEENTGGALSKAMLNCARNVTKPINFRRLIDFPAETVHASIAWSSVTPSAGTLEAKIVASVDPLCAGYLIEISDDNFATILDSVILDVAVTTHDFTGLATGDYYLRVRSVDANDVPKSIYAEALGTVSE